VAVGTVEVVELVPEVAVAAAAVDVVVAEVPGIENPRVGVIVVVAPVVCVVVEEAVVEVAKLSCGVVLVVVDCTPKEIVVGGVVVEVEVVVTPKLTGGVVVVVVPFVGFVPVAVFPNENDGVPPPEPVVVVGVKFGALNPPPPTVPKFIVGVVEEACVVVLV
jgi:hypothetical protein